MASAAEPAADPAPVADLSVARLARSLREFEHHLDAAIAAGGEIAVALVRARTARKLSAVVGQPVFTAFSEASLSVTQARAQAVKGHRVLETLGRQLGIDVSAYGDERKDPSDGVVAG